MQNAIPMEVAAEVEKRLQKIESSEGIRYLLAVESGSRAWGFPSPDSDLDMKVTMDATGYTFTRKDGSPLTADQIGDLRHD